MLTLPSAGTAAPGAGQAPGRHPATPEALAELCDCRDAGYQVFLVSASVSLYMDELSTFLPVTAVLCTRAVLDAEGRFTGKLETNCKGSVKVNRIQKELDQRCWIADWPHCKGYGDSLHDKDMLSLTGERCLINPGNKLRGQFPDARICHWKKKGN